MNIIKIYSPIDKEDRFNFHINYGVWDSIKGRKFVMGGGRKVDFDEYDIAFLPMRKRWPHHSDLLERIKDSKCKAVLFDNDSCYNSFKDPFYKGLDYIFYRDLDMNRRTPLVPSSWLPWSVDTKKYTMGRGYREGIAFNCATMAYPLRIQIAKYLKNTRYKGDKYINLIKSSVAAIHTNNDISPLPRAKVVEYAACGTQIISNRMKGMEYYFPDHLISYFESMNDFRHLLKTFEPDIFIRMELRSIAVEKHDNKVRAKEVIEKLESIQ